MAKAHKPRGWREFAKITPLGQIIATRKLKKLPLFEDTTVYFGIPKPHPKATGFALS
ncbi:MAG TPA: hypothetical protein VMT61_04340 [Candidatus Binataceae bacterium]|nr:hypothetical protein [Candidatus Binataceae bacterium]